MADIHRYLSQVARSFDGGDGYTLAEQVSLEGRHVYELKLSNDSDSLCQEMCIPPFDEMMAAHLRCIEALRYNNVDEAFACQMIVVQSFSKGFQAQKEENWALPVLQQVILDLRRLALKVERGKARGSISKLKKEGEVLEKAADQIMSCFRTCVADSRSSLDTSKRWGTLGIVNQLFKIYFKLNKLPLCKPLIRAIESSDIKDEFSISHRVTYKYFVGLKAVFDSEYKIAASSLEFAFTHCPPFNHKNRRLILIYLIPIKMMLGQMPKEELLRRYDLLQFLDVSQNICTGNLYMFMQSLQQYESFFIKAGIYLILEKLKSIVLRNLFKKVWLLLGKCHQLELKAFEDAMLYNKEEDIDSDEVECIVANLIDKNKIKGYISHQHQKLVVSKMNPFPSLYTAV